MPRSLELYLWDILDSSNTILEFTKSRTFAEYESDKMLRLAVERCFLTIGEAFAQIRQHHPSDIDRLPAAAAVVSFRNLLIHRYHVVNDRAVWDIIETELEPMLAEVHRLLAVSSPLLPADPTE